MQSFFWSVFSCIWNEYVDFSVFSPNTGKYGSEKSPHLDTFHAVCMSGKNHWTSRIYIYKTVIFQMTSERCQVFHLADNIYSLRTKKRTKKY